MNKLYSCSAICDRDMLRSYATTVVQFGTLDNEFVCKMHAYRSNTTLQHIRKYIEWLKEKHENTKAKIVKNLYDFCITYHHYYAIYNINTGEIYACNGLNQRV